MVIASRINHVTVGSRLWSMVVPLVCETILLGTWKPIGRKVNGHSQCPISIVWLIRPSHLSLIVADWHLHHGISCMEQPVCHPDPHYLGIVIFDSSRAGSIVYVTVPIPYYETPRLNHDRSFQRFSLELPVIVPYGYPNVPWITVPYTCNLRSQDEVSFLSDLLVWAFVYEPLYFPVMALLWTCCAFLQHCSSTYCKIHYFRNAAMY
jgi:hypothetical protein